MLFLPADVLCQSNRPTVLTLYLNYATDMDTLTRFTVCQTYLTHLIWLFLIKCTLKLIVSILCFLQSEINLNICAVGGMTLLYPHVPKIFTRDNSSCVVCLTLCNNHTIVFVLLYYRTTDSYFSCEFCYVSPHFYMFYLYYHICVCHVSINITYLLISNQA